MNVLFISHSSQRSGAETVLYNLLKWLPKDKYKLHCLFPRDGPILNDIKNLGVETYISELKWWVSKDKNPPYEALDFCLGLKDRIGAIVEIVRANNIQLIITNTIVIGDGGIAARISKIPHIWYIHEILSKNPGLHAPIPLKQFYSLIVSLSESVVAVSQAVKKEIEDYTGNSAGKISVMYNALETTENTLLKSNKASEHIEQVVMSAGYICRNKGFLTLLRSAKYVCDQIPEAKFVIAGGVSENDYYENLLIERKRLRLEKNVFFVGYQDDINSLYNSASLFVLPSKCEAFSMVLLEAMNAGLPVIATESGGPQEIIIEGKNGFLVPVDDEKKMADKIIYLLKNKRIANEMGLEGRQRIKSEFNHKKYVDNMSNLFSDVILRSHKATLSAKTEMLLLDIFDSFGVKKWEVLAAVNFFDKIRQSFPARVYRRLGPLKRMAGKVIGID